MTIIPFSTPFFCGTTVASVRICILFSNCLSILLIAWPTSVGVAHLKRHAILLAIPISGKREQFVFNLNSKIINFAFTQISSCPADGRRRVWMAAPISRCSVWRFEVSPTHTTAHLSERRWQPSEPTSPQLNVTFWGSSLSSFVAPAFYLQKSYTIC